MARLRAITAIPLIIVVLVFFTGAGAQAAGVQSGFDFSFLSKTSIWFGSAVSAIARWLNEQGSKAARALVQENAYPSGEVLGESVFNSELTIQQSLRGQAANEESNSAQMAEGIIAPVLGAQLAGQSLNTVLAEPEEDKALSVTYINSGDAVWQNQEVSLNVVWAKDQDHPLNHFSWITKRRPVSAIGNIGARQAYTFGFLIGTPEQPGIYELNIRPVVFKDGQFTWLGGAENMASWTVTVEEPIIEEAEEIVEEITEVPDEVAIVPEEPASLADKAVEEMVEPAPSEPQMTEPSKVNPVSFILILARDANPPSSSISALAASNNKRAFSVSWQGEDNIHEAVENFDIQYKFDGNAWTDWLLETTLMTSIFSPNDSGTYGFRSRSRDLEGNLEEYPYAADASTTVDLAPTHDVVINEIAWAGTAASDSDEWIELYNPGNADIDLTGWTIKNDAGSFSVTLSGTIASTTYFLLEREDDNTVLDMAANIIYNGELSDSGERLWLEKSDGSIVDAAGSATLAWFAGDNSAKTTMERIYPDSDGASSDNWASNDTALINGQDALGANLKGTPGSLNSQDNTIPRPVNDLQQQFVYLSSTSARLYWTSPKLGTTTAPLYDIRYTSGAGACSFTESDFGSAIQVSLATTGADEPAVATTQGTIATSTVASLTAGTTYCFGMKTGNGVATSTLSNIAVVNTRAGNTTTNFGTLLSGGHVVSDLTIASSSSPYLITADVIIDANKTLTIEPGTVLKMNGNYTINVNGRLVLGSASDSVNAVVITSKHDDTYAGDTNGNGSATSPSTGEWNRIAANTAASSIDFNNAIIRYGGFNLAIIYLSAGAHATTTTSIIENSANYGINLSGDATTIAISNSTIQNNFDGIKLDNSANLSVSGTTFTGNRLGIDTNSAVDEANVVISANNFYANNGAYGINNNGANPKAGVRIVDIDGTPVALSNNWWGSASGPTLDSHSTADDIDGVIDNNLNGLLDATVVTVNPASSAFAVKPNSL